MNFEFSILSRDGKIISRFFFVVVLSLPLVLASCSKNPKQMQEEGMKALAAGDYAKAQEYFADGIKKEGNERLYAGFIVTNLVTGKYPKANSAYNFFCQGIHNFLAGRYGEGIFFSAGITTKLIPFKINGGNDIPSDYMQTILLQAGADFSGFAELKDRINSILKK